MSQGTENRQVQKKTFNIDFQNIKEMEFFIARRKQTAFVNKAISQALEQMKKEHSKKEALQALKELSAMRKNTEINDGQTSVELVRELRENRVDYLCEGSGVSDKS
jgi:predicted PP-loop superfamily ATPase